MISTKKILVGLGFILLLQSIATAQPEISFEKSTHDFGRVANLSYPPASFHFTNTGNQPLAILMVNKAPAIKVSYPRGFIQPGETGQILVLPNLNALGEFNEPVKLMTNIGMEEIELQISGEVLSLQECFPNPNNWNIREIRVSDEETKLPIEGVEIDLTHNMNTSYKAQTGKEGSWVGEMLTGQYNFKLSANGYEPLSRSQFIARSVPVIFFEMKPIIAPAEILEPEEPEVPSIEEPIVEEPPIDLPPELPAEPEPENPNQLSITEYGANNIVLLVDVSLSMRSGNKLGLLQVSMRNLVDVLRRIDNVSLISYAQSPNILVRSTPGNRKQEIIEKIDGLSAAGITNGVKGLESAYELAKQKKVTNGNNQVILATDGKFTGGSIKPEEIQQYIQQEAEAGIILSIIGYGVDEEAMAFMAKMAESGKGTYIHVTTKDDISQTLIEEIKANSRIGQ